MKFVIALELSSVCLGSFVVDFFPNAAFNKNERGYSGDEYRAGG